jgi:hypothetical protein
VFFEVLICIWFLSIYIRFLTCREFYLGNGRASDLQNPYSLMPASGRSSDFPVQRQQPVQHQPYGLAIPSDCIGRVTRIGCLAGSEVQLPFGWLLSGSIEWRQLADCTHRPSRLKAAAGSPGKNNVAAGTGSARSRSAPRSPVRHRRQSRGISPCSRA